MMKTAIFLTTMALLAFSWGVKFEFTIYDSYVEGEGNVHLFRTAVPTTETYSDFSGAVRVCHSRTVYAYYYPNYAAGSTPPYRFLGAGCQNVTSGFFSTYESFRALGGPDTELDGVYLYRDVNMAGSPLLVDHSPFSANGTTVRSVAYSGYSAWTVYEGSNFVGKTACLPAGDGVKTMVYDDVRDLNITTIGSLVKGCLVPIPPEIGEEVQRDGKTHNQPASPLFPTPYVLNV